MDELSADAREELGVEAVEDFEHRGGTGEDRECIFDCELCGEVLFCSYGSVFAVEPGPNLGGFGGADGGAGEVDGG